MKAVQFNEASEPAASHRLHPHADKAPRVTSPKAKAKKIKRVTIQAEKPTAAPAKAPVTAPSATAKPS